MTIEIFYLTTQMQRWLNFQVARHLEAQAAKLKPAMTKLGADGPGGSVGLDRMGMPEACYPVDETESIDTIHGGARASNPAAEIGTPDSENQVVHA